MCKFTRRETIEFALLNTVYRITALIIFLFTGLMTGHWWPMWSYGALVALTFIIIEPRLLCSHCPFYALEGKTLRCGGLWGMPKFWKYRPAPITPWKQYTMVILGAIIDLVPLIGVIIDVIVFFLLPPKTFLLGLGMFGSIVIFLGLVYFLSIVLLKDRCKRCPNFSCKMNQTPSEYIRIFLAKNPVMRRAWETADGRIKLQSPLKKSKKNTPNVFFIRENG